MHDSAAGELAGKLTEFPADRRPAALALPALADSQFRNSQTGPLCALTARTTPPGARW